MLVNSTWNYYKAKVKATLSSDEGKAIYRRRKFDVELVFGYMERDFGIRRTHLCGHWTGPDVTKSNEIKLQSISRL